jgi:hypothetical protein
MTRQDHIFRLLTLKDKTCFLPKLLKMTKSSWCSQRIRSNVTLQVVLSLHNTRIRHPHIENLQCCSQQFESGKYRFEISVRISATLSPCRQMLTLCFEHSTTDDSHVLHNSFFITFPQFDGFDSWSRGRISWLRFFYAFPQSSWWILW